MWYIRTLLNFLQLMCQHVWHHIVDGVCVFEFIGCGRLVQVHLLTVEFAVDLGYVVC